MPEGAAVNASPLIYLSRIGHLDLLRVLPRPIVVPEPVFDELAAGVPREPAVQAVEWLEVVAVTAAPQEVRAWDLGAGESAVLAWVRSHPAAVAVIDDLQGRRCAASLGLAVVGTLSVLVAAKRLGHMDAIRPMVLELLAHGMYLSERIVREVLAVAGE
ncbi:MAG: DUF3368 domain-containing protein [Planctomycetes bacterium]|nr:DUF3368 domain-containing protein [Planctomycetota bacterium]